MKNYLDYIEKIMKKLEKGKALSSKELKNLETIQFSSFLLFKICFLLKQKNANLDTISITMTNGNLCVMCQNGKKGR